MILSEETPFAVQEAYKLLRQNVILSSAEAGCKRIVVTSSMQGETKSTTSLNLALAFVQNRAKVVLVDCDLRLPALSERLCIQSTAGLSNFLTDTGNVNEILFKVAGGLHFIPAGDTPPNPTELLGSKRMQALLDTLSKYYDYVILDTPPINTVVDASILGAHATGALLVVRKDVATQESVSHAIRQLEFTGCKILGFVFACADTQTSKQYDYYYGNKYRRSSKKQTGSSL